MFLWSGECDTVLSLVTGNSIGDGGATALAKALESNSALTTLNIGGACFVAAIGGVDVAMNLMCAVECDECDTPPDCMRSQTSIWEKWVYRHWLRRSSPTAP
jgi:hypothetical protein